MLVEKINVLNIEELNDFPKKPMESPFLTHRSEGKA